ncbi:DNA (cytosine-5-)-methyltransferase [Paraburkholderia sp. 1N]|uniref:Cytosine-specific methyltransferase n=1 Tax=Paraburkholderia solitsugae TaxID=2675748 RepID=A0ABX2C2A5_9BURK|nr:DNA (cytosine-5-)-methyltransferase [Paraburkholderia solitsugae]NPT47165.1 DNA (cytosine-5-)-methyltransferase [Paraburkholderia solitsugae]
MSVQGSQKQNELNVVELFAGVGGFRLGLEAVHGRPYTVTLSNQFEPSKKKQHASEIYTAHWPYDVHINEDIAKLLESSTGQQAIRDAKPDLVVGGFPCQDYSVARPLSQSRGLEGRKGVLFWSITKLLEQRSADGEPVPYLILENVDRLLSSPAPSRGRDFAVVLSALHSLGYAVEWRVINASDYGYPQRRRRVFIVAYHTTTALHGRVKAAANRQNGEWHSEGVLNAALPNVLCSELDGYAPALTVQADPFNEQLSYRQLSNGKSRFANSGFMCEGHVWTCAARVEDIEDFTQFTGSTAPLTLGDVIDKTGLVPTDFYVKPESEPAWRAAKGAKTIAREKNGFAYDYSEGSMAFPDPLSKPARTIITSEGGTTPSRTKHCVREKSGLLRRLTPEELEELMGFPRGFTDFPRVSATTRAMLMGNALVVGIVTRIGTALYKAVQD